MNHPIPDIEQPVVEELTETQKFWLDHVQRYHVSGLSMAAYAGSTNWLTNLYIIGSNGGVNERQGHLQPDLHCSTVFGYFCRWRLSLLIRWPCGCLMVSRMLAAGRYGWQLPGCLERFVMAANMMRPISPDWAVYLCDQPVDFRKGYGEFGCALVEAQPTPQVVQ